MFIKCSYFYKNSFLRTLLSFFEMDYNKLLLEHLKQSLYKHRLTSQIGLSKNQYWKQSHYKTFAKALNTFLESKLSSEQQKTLGTTISVSTLERIFKHGYTIPSPIDGRRLKTLDKLSIVLGHNNWNAFSNAYLQSIKSPFSAQDVKQLIQNALQAEFDAYKNIPKIDASALEQYFVPNGSALKKILATLETVKSKNHTLQNKNNPSTFELLEVQLKEEIENEIIVTTREYWYLSWYHPKRKRYDYGYNVVNEQIYILTKTGNNWKIRVNIYNATQAKSPSQP